MKNYISLNGKKIELTPEQVAQMQKSLGIGGVMLKTIPVGEPFRIGEYEFIVLEHSKDTTAVTLKNLLYDSKEFGNNNNYDGSYVDKMCQEFGLDIADVIGAENLIVHTVDLTSDDGLKDYGKVKRHMSLLTANLYRRYVEILDKHKLDKWWWLATAYSAPTHNDSSWIKCVSPSGGVYNNDYGGSNGVRPFCILNSNIFVSKI